MTQTTAARTVHVLVADDNEDHRFFITRALRGFDDVRFVVSAVADGDEALAYLRREVPYGEASPPHFLLLDLRMPRKSGLEVLDELRADDDLRQLPVVVLSTSDRIQDVTESYRRGTNTYVVKGESFEGMTQVLRAVSDFWVGVAQLPEP